MKKARDAGLVMSVLVVVLWGAVPVASQDDCSEAMSIGVGTVSGETTSATNDGTGSCGESATAPDVWFLYRSSDSCTIELDTCGSDYDTVLSVYSDCPSDGGTELACNDDSCDRQSAVSIFGEAQRSYRVRVSGWEGATGNFQLNVRCIERPADDCVLAAPIAGGSLTGSTAVATNDGSSACGRSESSPDVWFSYTPEADCLLRVDTCGSDYDTVLSVHDACPATQANEIACNDDSCGLDSAVSFFANADTRHVIRVSGYNGATGNFTLNVTCVDAEDPDHCGLAQVIEADSTLGGDTSKSAPSGLVACSGSPLSPDLWFVHTTTEACVLELRTCGAEWDTILSIYSACPAEKGDLLGCNDDACGVQSVLRHTADADTTYWIRVSGYSQTSSGPFGLRLDCLPPPELSDGADLAVTNFGDMRQVGRLGGEIACGMSSTLCNLGLEPLDWYANPDPRHPMLVFNMYRIEHDRIRQIGQSWAKHGFGAAQADICGIGCSPHPNNTRLGTGCADIYGTATNVNRHNIGPRHEIDPWTGSFTFAGSHIDENSDAEYTPVDLRLRVKEEDLDPQTHPTAQFFGELYAVAHDDADHTNSLGWEPVGVQGQPGRTWSFDADSFEATFGPALDAWEGATRTVIPEDPELDGRVIVAMTATPTGDGLWHYEYGIYNLDLSRGVGSFTVPVSPRTRVDAVGFHAVESHGEGYGNEPWMASRDDDGLTWSTQPFGFNELANPLRWGTLYSFWFDADVEPADTVLTVGAYQPGDPSTLSGVSRGPDTAGVPFKRGDTDGNGVVEMSDAIAVLEFLFLGGPAPPCFDAADADDSNDLDVSDGVRVLGWLFLGTEPPSFPGPTTCGSDSTPAVLPFPVCEYDPGNC